MVESDGLICASTALVDGGDGVRFTVRQDDGAALPAFAIRHRREVHAYANRCAHRGVELDWEPGRFFDRERQYLICATHGALYAPATGACRGGPCGGGLVKLAVIEKNNVVYLVRQASTDEEQRQQR
jgi:nitrite reductase/ring-hydroxylating ferredoxin subunit